ncbi:hypothetical protein [Rhodococcoides fascians]|uniref:hypothetical protein n=1 Tax=Rhodococcoides fascians TaxID=1828 RepID=UPI00050C17CF|nr:hypothetical protein [Rhodococcus fascians]
MKVVAVVNPRLDTSPRPTVYVGGDWVNRDTPDPFVYTDPACTWDQNSFGRKDRVDVDGQPTPLQAGEAYIRQSNVTHDEWQPGRPRLEVWTAGENGSDGERVCYVDTQEQALNVARVLNQQIGIEPQRPSRRGALRTEQNRLRLAKREAELHLAMVDAEIASEKAAGR